MGVSVTLQSISAGSNSAPSETERERSHCADGQSWNWDRCHCCRAHSEAAGKRVCHQGQQPHLLANPSGRGSCRRVQEDGPAEPVASRSQVWLSEALAARQGLVVKFFLSYS